MIKRCLLSLFIGLLLFSSCKAIEELVAFTKCKFRHTTLHSVTLGGVNVDRIKNYQSLNFTDAAVVAAYIMQSRLPLNFTINIELQNPNAQLAALDRIDYVVLVDGAEIANGSNDRRIEIAPNNGVATLSLEVGTDLFKLFSKGEMEKIKDFAFGLADPNGNVSSRVTVKIKPSVTIGKTTFTDPGYITLSHNFN